MVMIIYFTYSDLVRFDVESKGMIDVEEMKFVLKNLPVKVTDDEVEEMYQSKGGERRW